MSTQFPHQQIDSKWREIWKKNETYKPNLQAVLEKEGAEGGRLKDKFYALVALPYPSGSGLHVGHMYCFNPVDILARYERMTGKEVILPIGWDSFGLPAENYAVKTGIHPNITTEDAIKNFKWQLELAGFSTYWESHELAAHWESYYKWTQWIFLQMYKDGFAYRAKAPVNWCPNCQTVLANEQVVNGKCERCENLVIQKDMEQWFMKITEFSERLYRDLDKVDWPESTKAAQRNWIGRSEGAEIDFKVIIDSDIASLGEAPRSGEGVKKKKLVIHKYNPDLVDLANQKRKSMTDSEVAIWSILKGDKIGNYDWTRQKVIGNYIVDFYCNELELALEIDGKYHDYTNDSDKQRQDYLEHEAIKVVRITNDEVRKNWSMLDSWLIEVCNNRAKEVGFTPSVSLRSPASQGKQYNKLKVFTTRPDTIYGATFMVIAPEHEMLSEMQEYITNTQEVEEYKNQAKLKSQLERESQKEKTGIEIKGIKAINPITKTEIPIFIADYVLNTYGTGAIMAVPAHDERDGEFANKYGLEFKQVIAREIGEKNANEEFRKRVKCIVKNQENRFLILKWDTGNYTPVSGGIEDKEDVVSAALRELQEETGYYKIKDIKELDTIIEHFYATNKKLYRCSETHNVFMNIDSTDMKELSLEENEKGRFQPLWVTKEEYLKLVDHDSKDLFDEIDGKKEIITDGKFINSDILNGLNISEAKVKIIEELEKLGIGHSKITYRLRDWLISRQRYWGCPIPMVYLPKLIIKDEKLKDQSFSYLMGAEKINDQDLSNLDISFTQTESGNRNCIINNSELGNYKKLIQEKLSNEFWNEVISENEVWFCFKDKSGNLSEYILDNENYKEILTKCNEFMGKVRFENLYDMLIENDFYSNYFNREIVSIDEKYLPLKLPVDVEFKPTGESPIAHSESYKKLAEELYGVGARFEYDTMDTFIDSSWYYMRYLNANDDTKAFDTELCNAWLPTDLYMIGPEHTVLHLMYSRFFTKYFFDKGMISYDEPFYKMRHQGMIAGADGRKMSKRYGNVINPSDICEKYGADTLRVYEMFMGPLEQGKNWSDETVIGVRRFIDRIWNFAEKLSSKEEVTFSESARNTINKFNITFEPVSTIDEAREIKRINIEGWYDNNTSEETGVDISVLQNVQGYIIPNESTDLSNYFENLKRNSGNYVNLAIKSNGKTIGWLGSFRNKKEEHQEIVLYIDRGFRGKGIGSVGMEYIINKFSNKDLYLGVVSTNKAINLYKKFGFIEYGTEKYMLKDNVHYLPVANMVRRFKYKFNLPQGHIIRNPRPEDAKDIWISLAEGWQDNNTSPENGVDSEFIKNVQGYDENRDIEDVLKDKPWLTSFDQTNNLKFVYEINGEVAGWFSLWKESSTENYSLGIYLKRKFRGQGIGSRALDYLFNNVAPNQDIILNVTKGNKAIELYKRFGFKVTGESKHEFVNNHVWPIVDMIRSVSTPKVKSELQKLTKYITVNIPELKFNTCVAEFMKFQNLIEKNPSSQSEGSIGEGAERSEAEGLTPTILYTNNLQSNNISIDDFVTYLKLFAPFAPFITDELWHKLTNTEESLSIHQTSWPTYDESLITTDELVIGVQVNGKLRGEVMVAESDTEDSIKQKVINDPKITKWFDGKEIKKFIYIKEKS